MVKCGGGAFHLQLLCYSPSGKTNNLVRVGVCVSALNPDNGGSSCDKRPCDAGVSLNCSLARGPHFLNVAVPPEIAQPWWEWLFFLHVFVCLCVHMCARDYDCEPAVLFRLKLVTVLFLDQSGSRVINIWGKEGRYLPRLWWALLPPPPPPPPPHIIYVVFS